MKKTGLLAIALVLLLAGPVHSETLEPYAVYPCDSGIAAGLYCHQEEIPGGQLEISLTSDGSYLWIFSGGERAASTVEVRDHDTGGWLVFSRVLNEDIQLVGDTGWVQRQPGQGHPLKQSRSVPRV